MLFGKLGKKTVRHDSRTLRLSKYLKPTLLAAPASMGYTSKCETTYFVPWPMMLNDAIGDCTCAAAGHMIGEWTADANKPYMPTDQNVLTAYEAVSGYVPGDSSTDNGAVMLDVLNYWRKTGIGSHNIDAYAQIDPANAGEIRAAIYLFGSVYLGIQLPLSAQGKPFWSVPSYGPTQDGTPGSWGGHCIPIVGYSDAGMHVITWGQKFTMSWSFLRTYADEAYGVLSLDWMNKAGLSVSGFDLKTLQADLGAITG
jgi:hypothetical protein